MIVDIIFWLTLSTGAVWVVSVLALAAGLGRLRRFESDSKPSVSVLIAARNEEKNIGKCLSALGRQDYPEELREIIVIDDSSTDRTGEIAAGFTDTISGLRVLQAGAVPDGVAPKKNALIKGIEASNGEIILTTDADCEPPSGWISGIISCFEPEIDAVVGFSPITGKGVTGALCKFDSLANAVISAGTLGLGIPGSAVGRNFAYRRTAWNDVGGFGSSASGASGDDDLLLQRIGAAGGRIAFATDPGSFVPAKGKESLSDWLSMKRRHFSAGKRYKPDLILFSGLLYLFNPALIVGTVLAAVGSIDWQTIIAIWGAKIAVDGLTLSRGARLFRQRGWVFAWLIGEFVSPLLFTLLIPSSMFGRITWKDRSLKT